MKKLFLCVTALALTGLAYGASASKDEFRVSNQYNGNLRIEAVGNKTLDIVVPSKGDTKINSYLIGKFSGQNHEPLSISVMDSDRHSTRYQVQAPKDGWIVPDKETGRVYSLLLVYPPYARRGETLPSITWRTPDVQEQLQVTKWGWSASF
jgi:hypothetical protein